MDTISRREMRNSSGEVLRRVAAGEALVVPDRGQPAAVLMPVRPSSRERLVAAGVVRPATRPLDVRAWRTWDLPDVDSSETMIEQLRPQR